MLRQVVLLNFFIMKIFPSYNELFKRKKKKKKK